MRQFIGEGEGPGEFERKIPVGGDRRRRPILGDIQAFPGMERELTTTWVDYLSTPAPRPRPRFRPVLRSPWSSTPNCRCCSPFRLHRAAQGFRPRRAGCLRGDGRPRRALRGGEEVAGGGNLVKQSFHHVNTSLHPWPGGGARTHHPQPPQRLVPPHEGQRSRTLVVRRGRIRTKLQQ